MSRTSTLALSAVAALAGGLVLGARPAHALVLIQIPDGTPTTTATDTLSLSDSYATPLPSPTAQPFAGSDFSLTFNVPTQYSFTLPSKSVGFISAPVSGSYTDNGLTTAFSGAFAWFQAGGTPEGLNLQIDNFLTPGGTFTLQIDTAQPLVSQVVTVAPGSSPTVIATLTTGSFAITGGYGDYVPPGALDPQGSFNLGGTGQIGPAAVPEPASLPLLLTATLGLLALRPRRSDG